MMITFDKGYGRRASDCRAKMEVAGLSYGDIARAITARFQYISRGTVFKALNDYENRAILEKVEVVLMTNQLITNKEAPQWLRLWEWYMSGREMTARDFVTIIGPTQIHGRHIEIRKHKGYEIAKPGTEPEGKYIYCRWEGEGKGKYLKYWIPKNK
jgi:hypothetical protein